MNVTDLVRPQTPAMAMLDHLLERIARFEERIAELRAELPEVLASFRTQTPAADIRDVFLYLYWEYRDVPSSLLAEKVMGCSIGALVGTGQIEPLELLALKCPVCGSPPVAHSRSDLKKSRGLRLCQSCHEERFSVQPGD